MSDHIKDSLTRIEALLQSIANQMTADARARKLDAKDTPLAGSGLLSVRQVAKTLGVAEITVRKQLSEGRFPIPTIKVGARRMVRCTDLETYVQGHAEGRDAI